MQTECIYCTDNLLHKDNLLYRVLKWTLFAVFYEKLCIIWIDLYIVSNANCFFLGLVFSRPGFCSSVFASMWVLWCPADECDPFCMWIDEVWIIPELWIVSALPVCVTVGLDWRAAHLTNPLISLWKRKLARLWTVGLEPHINLFCSIQGRIGRLN